MKGENIFYNLEYLSAVVLVHTASTSMHSSSIQSSLAFFVPCPVYLLISVVSVAFVVSPASFIFLTSLSHRSSILSVTQDGA